MGRLRPGRVSSRKAYLSAFSSHCPIPASRRDMVPSSCTFTRRKGRRPVVIVSLDARNRHERADTVLVVPLTTSIHKDSSHARFLSAGETASRLTALRMPERHYRRQETKTVRIHSGLRRLSNAKICELAVKVALAMAAGRRADSSAGFSPALTSYGNGEKPTANWPSAPALSRSPPAAEARTDNRCNRSPDPTSRETCCRYRNAFAKPTSSPESS